MSAGSEASPSHRKPLSSGLVLLIASGFGHVANLLFQVIMGRMLGKDQFDEYGVMNTMLSICGLFAVPASALQLAIARQTAILDAKGDADSVAAILQRATRRLGTICLGLVVVLLAVSPWLKEYLRLPRYDAIFVTAGIVVSAVILPVSSGGLQGLKRFGWLSVIGVATPLIRVGFGVLLVWLGGRAAGALAGTFAANMVIVVMAMLALGGYFRRRVSLEAIDTSLVYRYLGPTLVSLIAYAALVNLDLVIVKHYFSPNATAEYSAASLFGRAIGWLIAPLCTVLFPHVWDETQHHANRKLLMKFLLAAVGLGIAAAILCSLGRSLLSLLLLGRADPEVIELIPICAWAMLPIGVANVFLNFAMARGQYGFLAAFVALAVLYVTALCVWHESLAQVLTVVGSFGVLTLAMFVAALVLQRRESGR